MFNEVETRISVLWKILMDTHSNKTFWFLSFYCFLAIVPVRHRWGVCDTSVCLFTNIVSRKTGVQLKGKRKSTPTDLRGGGAAYTASTTEKTG